MTVELPQTLTANPSLSTWLTVHHDGSWDLRVGKVELGQGILTALTQIAARELGVDPAMVTVAHANTDDAPDEGITAGSMSIAVSGTSVRRVAAEVRHVFLRAASKRSGIPAARITVVDGRFLDLDGSTLTTYGDLADEVDLHVDAGDPTLPVEFADKTSGPDLARVDLPDKVFGRLRTTAGRAGSLPRRRVPVRALAPCGPAPDTAGKPRCH